MVHTGASREYRMNGYLSQLTPAAARYAADLAEWAARQHARTEQARVEAERARLLEAVRVAEEAREAARSHVCDAWEAMNSADAAARKAQAHLRAAEEKRMAADACVNAARKAAGL